MAALTASRNTVRMGDDVMPERTNPPVKGAAHIYEGALVVMNGGYAAPGSTALNLIAAGIATKEADNTTGADGAIAVPLRQGVFKFDNSAAGDLIAQANVGADCYIVDDHTVALTSGTNTRSRAGKVIQVDTNGVWVQVGIGL